MGERFTATRQYKGYMRRLRELKQSIDPNDEARYAFWSEFQAASKRFNRAAYMAREGDVGSIESANAAYNEACKRLLASQIGEIVFSERCAQLAALHNNHESAEACRQRSEELILERTGALSNTLIQDIQGIRYY